MLTHVEELAQAMRETVHNELKDVKELGLMFSGGLDSSLLAILARKNCDLTLYIAGMDGSNDLEWGKECACLLDIPHELIVITQEDVARSLANVISVHGMRQAKWMSTFVAFDIVLERILEPVAMCGQGADELFGGYRKYSEIADPGARISGDVDNLLRNEFPEYSHMAAHYGKRLLAPYLNPEIISLAASIPLEEKISAEENKIVLRQAARLLGVPGSMAERRKKAMQYGTGVSGAIKKHLKTNGLTLDAYIARNGALGK